MRYKPAPSGLSARTCAAILVMATGSAPAWAQSQPASNPRQVQAERPTVATHAFTVANAYLEIRPSLVLDAGAIISVSGMGDTAAYAGLTWNLGRLFGQAPRPQRTFVSRARH